MELPCSTDQGTIVQGCFLQVERFARILRGVLLTSPFVGTGIDHPQLWRWSSPVLQSKERSFESCFLSGTFVHVLCEGFCGRSRSLKLVSIIRPAEYWRWSSRITDHKTIIRGLFFVREHIARGSVDVTAACNWYKSSV